MFSARMTMLLLAAIVALPGAAQAQLKASVGDWPGWMGPDRTGVSPETGLLKQWPKEGPKVLWKVTDIGEGYSTPSIAAGKIYLMSNRGNNDEFALALNVKDGSKIWEQRIGKVGPNRGPQYPGSRSTPTVDGDAVYVLGSDGDLACLDAAKGEVRWKKSLRTDFGGNPGNWAYAESPLIDGDVLVCTPGGDKATLVALNKKNGEVIWKAAVPGKAGGRGMGSSNAPAYASAIVATVGGIKQYIQLLNGGLVGIAAKDGKLLWSYDKVTGSTMCNTPLFHDGYLLISENSPRGTGNGTTLLELKANENGGVTATEVRHSNTLAVHHGGVVRVGDAVYGATQTSLVCLDFKTLETKWQDRSVGKGSITAADGRLYVRSEKGPVALVEATPDAYKEIGRFEPPNHSPKDVWPHPVIAGGKLYLRDQKVLLCYDVKPE